MNKNTEIFSTYSPEELLGTIVDFAEKTGYKYQVADSKFKVKLEILEEGGEKVEIQARISRVDKEKYCVEFNRISGDSLDFYQKFGLIKEFFGELINSTY